MTFKDIAKIIKSVGITEKQVNTYFENKAEPAEPKPLPEITKAKVVAIADALYIDGIEAHNGVLGLAQETGLTSGQVKSVIREIKSLESFWSKSNEVVEE